MDSSSVDRRRFVQGVVSASVAGSVMTMNDTTSANNDLTERADFREHLLRSLGGPWPESGELEPVVTKTVNYSSSLICESRIWARLRIGAAAFPNARGQRRRLQASVHRHHGTASRRHLLL